MTARTAVRGLLALAILTVGAGSPAAGQGLAEYDYDQLSLRGIGFDVGYMLPNKVQDTPQYGIRFDLGYLGPGLRLMPRVGYFSSTMTAGEVSNLERRVAELVFDQNPLQPIPTVDLGVVDWSAVTLGLDAHFVWRVPFGVLTYLGGGFAAHFQNGGGDAIADTFVEDLLDSTVAGMNAHVGLEIPLSRLLRVYGDARYEFLGDLHFPAFRAGFQLMISGPAPGEEGNR